MDEIYFCKYCGKKIEHDGAFCPYCGNKLKEDNETENATNEMNDNISSTNDISETRVNK